jgi:hypothetical protein
MGAAAATPVTGAQRIAAVVALLSVVHAAARRMNPAIRPGAGT